MSYSSPILQLLAEMYPSVERAWICRSIRDRSRTGWSRRVPTFICLPRQDQNCMDQVWITAKGR